MSITLLPLTALIAMVPAALAPFRRSASKTVFFGLCGQWQLPERPFGCLYVSRGLGNRHIDSALAYCINCLVLWRHLFVKPDAWRLSPLLLPYLLFLGCLPRFGARSQRNLWWAKHHPPGSAHIFVSLPYGLVTLAAVAALAAAIQHRALRSKKRNRLSSILPAVSSSERLLVKLLAASEIVLALGLLTGMAALFFTSGQVVAFDHKSALALSVFFVLAILLLLHFKSGVRGKTATQLVLLAYLLLTLGYPGVKFVTDILLSSG